MYMAVSTGVPRVAQRKLRRSKRLRAYLRLLGSGLIGLALCVTTAWAGYMGYRLVRSADYFRLRMVRIVGHQTLTQQDILYLLDLSADATLFQLDLARMGTRLGRHPYVKTVILRREFPNTLIVTVQEREPYLVVQAEDQRLILDAEGVVLGSLPPQQDQGLPQLLLRQQRVLTPGMRLQQEEVQRALEFVCDYRASPITGAMRLVALTVEESGTVVFEVAPYPFKLRVGEGNLDAQLGRLPSVLHYITQQGLTVRSIDLSYRKQVIVLPAVS
jgi:cell division septal protein FtsQ